MRLSVRLAAARDRKIVAIVLRQIVRLPADRLRGDQHRDVLLQGGRHQDVRKVAWFRRQASTLLPPKKSCPAAKNAKKGKSVLT